MELSILELTNKEQIDAFVSKKVNDCLLGEINPLELRLQVSLIEKATDKIKDATKEMALNEALKHGKQFDFKGAKIAIQELGTKYDYTVCNDEEINNLLKEMDVLKLKLKARENFLKGIITSLDIVVNGEEVVTIYPPHKTSSTGLKITI